MLHHSDGTEKDRKLAEETREFLIERFRAKNSAQISNVKYTIDKFFVQLSNEDKVKRNSADLLDRKINRRNYKAVNS